MAAIQRDHMHMHYKVNQVLCDYCFTVEGESELSRSRSIGSLGLASIKQRKEASSILHLHTTPICHIFLLEDFPVICPRHDKLTVVHLLFSKFNSSQMPEFDNSWKLMTTRIFFLLL